MKDLSPDSFDALANKVLNDEQTAITYLWNKARQVGDRPTSCDESCRQGYYCDLTTTEQFENYICNGEKTIDFKKHFMDALFNTIVPDWIKKN